MYVAVMAKQCPEVIGDMMANMKTIVRAQKEFEDLGHMFSPLSGDRRLSVSQRYYFYDKFV